MPPPPIRYPLPSLAALLLAGLLAWAGERATRAWRVEVAARARRAIEGPPVPASTRPIVVAGPIVRRGLLLRDDTPTFDRPRGAQTGTIARRMFVDLYDAWPAAANPTHLRVGNRAPIGWVAADALLPWDTRLVVRPPSGKLTIDDTPVEVGPAACPVVGWRDGAVEVAVWSRDQPWQVVARRGWVKSADLPPDTWGVWIGQVELPALLRLAIDGDPATARLRAILGRLNPDPIAPADLAAARAALPATAFDPSTIRPGAVDRLAEANTRPAADARWSGLSFRFLPLGDLP